MILLEARSIFKVLTGMIVVYKCHDFHNCIFKTSLKGGKNHKTHIRITYYIVSPVVENFVYLLLYYFLYLFSFMKESRKIKKNSGKI